MIPPERKRKYPVAAVQAAPVFRNGPDYFDTKAALDKAITLIESAGRRGARLIVFPEGWLPCFTYWSLDLRERATFRDIWVKYLWSSIEVPGPETASLGRAAKKAGAYLIMGINERDRVLSGRMYNSALFIDPQGEILGVHRKICNTLHERLFHTPGDGGKNLKTVFPSSIGRLGASICGEHSQLALLYYWILQGVQIHGSLWPGSAGLRTIQDIKTRAFCNTAHCFGILAAACLPEEGASSSFYGNSLFSLPGSISGGSGIVNPEGEYIAGPVYGKETIVYADIALAETDAGRYGTNLTGIYDRSDIITLALRGESPEPIVVQNSERTLAGTRQAFDENNPAPLPPVADKRTRAAKRTS